MSVEDTIKRVKPLPNQRSLFEGVVDISHLQLVGDVDWHGLMKHYTFGSYSLYDMKVLEILTEEELDAVKDWYENIYTKNEVPHKQKVTNQITKGRWIFYQKVYDDGTTISYFDLVSEWIRFLKEDIESLEQLHRNQVDKPEISAKIDL